MHQGRLPLSLMGQGRYYRVCDDSMKIECTNVSFLLHSYAVFTFPPSADSGTPDSNAYCQACFDLQGKTKIKQISINQNKINTRHWGLGVPSSVWEGAQC